ncbi:MAG TPA: hypothetical protein ENN66_07560 [Proteobacteria bacterium]|nr:hypothetical protein [Pseudomonadota bacterium]
MAELELLVLKVGDSYLRLSGDDCREVLLAQASVFPLSETETVRRLLAQVRSGLFPSAVIRRLELREGPFPD